MSIHPLRYDTTPGPTISDTSGVPILPDGVPANTGSGFVEWGGEAVQFGTVSDLRNALNTGLVYYNVKNTAYAGGAKGDGVTDDTAAIQAALDAAGTAGGGTVFFPYGVYVTSATLTVKSGVYVRGVGMFNFTAGTGYSKIILNATATVPAIANADQVNGNSNIFLERLYIVGGNAGTAHAVSFVATGNNTCQTIKILDCTIQRASGATIYLNNVGTAEIRGNYLLAATTYAIDCEAVSDSWIVGNQMDTLATTGLDGIYVNAGGNNHITDNFIFLCRRGIVLTGATKGNTVIGNRPNTNNNEGIYVLGGATNNVINGNLLYDNCQAGGSGAGILLWQSATQNVVVGNKIFDNAASGSKKTTVGIQLDGGSGVLDNTVGLNNCVGVENSGVNVVSAGPNLISDNSLSHAATGGWVRGVGSESITLSTVGATTDSSTNLLPANSIIDAVDTYVETTLTTATSFSVGDATTAARFINGSTGINNGNTAVGLQHMQGSTTTDAAGPVQTAAAKVRITCNITPGAGKIRVTVHYRQFVAPAV